MFQMPWKLGSAPCDVFGFLQITRCIKMHQDERHKTNKQTNIKIQDAFFLCFFSDFPSRADQPNKSESGSGSAEVAKFRSRAWPVSPSAAAVGVQLHGFRFRVSQLFPPNSKDEWKEGAGLARVDALFWHMHTYIHHRSIFDGLCLVIRGAFEVLLQS